MQRYFEPLRAYAQGSGWRGLGESADLVNGFFASRLAQGDYLLKWRDSGLPLRRWLMNGLLLHLHERARAERRAMRRAEPHDPGLLQRLALAAEHDPDAERAADRAWAEAVVQAAVRETVQQLDRAGRAQAWANFRRHFVDGIAYDAIAGETGVSVRELKAQAKLVQRWLRAGIVRVLQEDGVAPEAIEAETDRLVSMLLG
jgi:non-ribosomal peptide synthetase component F